MGIGRVNKAAIIDRAVQENRGPKIHRLTMPGIIFDKIKGQLCGIPSFSYGKSANQREASIRTKETLLTLDLSEKERTDLEHEFAAVGFKEGMYHRVLLTKTGCPAQILLLFWNKSNNCPIHTHGADENSCSCWVKVLSGKMIETRYRRNPGSKPTLMATDTYTANSGPTYMSNEKGMHKLDPALGTSAISLH